MSLIAISDTIVAVAKGLYIDCYDRANHKIININETTSPKDDKITDIVISYDSKYLAALTSTSKSLKIFNLHSFKEESKIVLPRSASKIRFAINNSQIVVADKTGDVLIYNITGHTSGTKLFGHLSLLLNVLQTNDGKYIISSDRDEKIRVTCYPNTYSIHTYCLGHKEFVNHIDILPHNNKYLISTSGDGTMKCWNYEDGKLCHTVDVHLDVSEDHLKEEFRKHMDAEGIEVDNLPIVLFSSIKKTDCCTIIAVAVHSVNKLFIYTIQSENQKFSHKLIEKLHVAEFPTAIQFLGSSLYVYYDKTCEVIQYNLLTDDSKINLDMVNKIPMFEDKQIISDTTTSDHNSIKVLFKRKFDNVQEYQERKKQRLGIV